MRRFNWTCGYCSVLPAATLDHFVALASGGAHDERNAVAACKPCNSKKQDFDPFMWMAQQGIDASGVVARMYMA